MALFLSYALCGSRYCRGLMEEFATVEDFPGCSSSPYIGGVLAGTTTSCYCNLGLPLLWHGLWKGCFSNYGCRCLVPALRAEPSLWNARLCRILHAMKRFWNSRLCVTDVAFFLNSSFTKNPRGSKHFDLNLNKRVIWIRSYNTPSVSDLRAPTQPSGPVDHIRFL